MKHYNNFFILIGLFLTLGLKGQNEIPVVFEADSGTVGTDFTILEESGVRFVRVDSNGTGQAPLFSDRIITFNVTFPDSGNYDLYCRIRIGAGGADDDSYFYGNGFGTKDTTDANQWIRANNIWGIGYSEANAVVDGLGATATNTWKWINLSEYTGDESPVVFRVGKDNLTQIFQIGSRENGLSIDKLAFARSDYYFTVRNLDNREPGSAVIIPEEDTLGPPLATGKCKFLGCGYDNLQSPDFENYFNQITPGNGGKWGWVEGTRDVMSWGDLDKAYALAQDSGFHYKHHVLVWGNQQPSWIETLDSAEQRTEIEEWFSAVAARYPDMDMIEVVNEPLHDPPNQAGSGGGNYIKALGGNGATGWDWIIESFKLARSKFPTTKLMINEYGIANSTTNTQNYIQIINLLKAQNLIDAIGLQAHAFSTNNASVTLIKSNLDLLAATGLPIYITEMDIDGLTDEIQLNEYKRVFPVFWEHPSVKGVTLWGFRVGLWRNEQKAYLLNADGSERPAMTWLREYIKDTQFNDDCMLAGSSIDGPDISSDNSVIVYPNPAFNKSFGITGIENYSNIRIFDLMGKQVKELKINKQSSVEIKLEGVKPGMYIIHVSNTQTSVYKNIILK